jgi:hypothetical protein
MPGMSSADQERRAQPLMGIQMHTFDPANDIADSLYVQIRDKGAQVKAINLRIEIMNVEYTTLLTSRAALVGELVALRDGITREITGASVPSEMIQMPVPPAP